MINFYTINFFENALYWEKLFGGSCLEDVSEIELSSSPSPSPLAE